MAGSTAPAPGASRFADPLARRHAGGAFGAPPPTERSGAARPDASAMRLAANEVTRPASDVSRAVLRPLGMRARAAATSSSSPTMSRTSATTPRANPDTSDRADVSELDTARSVSGTGAADALLGDTSRSTMVGAVASSPARSGAAPDRIGPATDASGDGTMRAGAPGADGVIRAVLSSAAFVAGFVSFAIALSPVSTTGSG